MNVKEFKEFLNRYPNNELAITAIQDFIKLFTNTECEIILQASFDRLKDIAWADKWKRMSLEQQLQMTKSYLKGEMYSNEEFAKQMLPKQIKNIEEVLNNENT